MMKRNRKGFVILGGLLSLGLLFCGMAIAKPNVEEALDLLKKGNERFVSGTSIHPNTSSERLILAGKEDQGKYAYATVITCSDSRVPVELLFDTGVMDTFVIRVAGNVVDVDEAGSIEYGLAHVKTPVLVVLGHTQCGAVTAVTHAIHGTGHPLERNIPQLVDNIEPAVRRPWRQIRTCTVMQLFLPPLRKTSGRELKTCLWPVLLPVIWLKAKPLR